jgi:hypothetical protein
MAALYRLRCYKERRAGVMKTGGMAAAAISWRWHEKSIERKYVKAKIMANENEISISVSQRRNNGNVNMAERNIVCIGRISIISINGENNDGNQ